MGVRQGLAALGVALIGSAAAAAGPPHDPEVFVRGLYAAYSGDETDYQGRGASRVFSRRLQVLIRRDAAMTPKGYVGALDGDPICDRQDADGLKLVKLWVNTRGQGRMTATVRLRFPGESRTLRLDLVQENGAWKVDDVHSTDMPSFAGLLKTHAGGR